MKSLPVTTVLPAIALGTVAFASQPAQAYGTELSDYSASDEFMTYGDQRVDVPALRRFSYDRSPSYHYAYYYLARPEYLL